MVSREEQLSALEVSCIDEDADRLGRLARTAAALTGDSSIEKAAAKVAKKAREDELYFRATGEQLEELVKNVHARVESSRVVEQDLQSDASYVAEKEALYQQLGQANDELARARAAVKARLSEEEGRIREILAEYDYINRLLRGAGSATDRQFDVMAFPRNVNAKTNVLQISGSAGTGKTLCLLAKLIQDTRPPRQMGMIAEAPKRGLFVCFNTALRMHVRELLARIPEAGDNIEVVSYDQFINQLVRANPAKEFAHLAQFTEAARYPVASATPLGRFWQLVYDKDIQDVVSAAMEAVAAEHPEDSGKYYLAHQDPANVSWMTDELAWLESRYEDPDQAACVYPGAERKGRGVVHRPDAEVRRIILEIWTAFRRRLEHEQQYTMEQATKRLLQDPDLPRYDAIAIDEVQDLTVASVRLLVRMRADEQSRVYICGDENQKIYKRDFTWSELDEGIHGHTITLDANKRNSAAIEAFANRLLEMPSSKEEASDLVFVGDWSEEGLMRLVGEIRGAYPTETTAVISGDPMRWYGLARGWKMPASSPRNGGVLEPGFYIIGALGGKGLEFDNVIVDCAHIGEADEGTLKSILYVNCTRARKRLYVRYADEPPEILQHYYADFLY